MMKHFNEVEDSPEMPTPKRLGIRIADVQSLSMLSPKRLGIRMANVQSRVTLTSGPPYY